MNPLNFSEWSFLITYALLVAGAGVLAFTISKKHARGGPRPRDEEVAAFDPYLAGFFFDSARGAFCAAMAGLFHDGVIEIGEHDAVFLADPNNARALVRPDSANVYRGIPVVSDRPELETHIIHAVRSDKGTPFETLYARITNQTEALGPALVDNGFWLRPNGKPRPSYLSMLPIIGVMGLGFSKLIIDGLAGRSLGLLAPVVLAPWLLIGMSLHDEGRTKRGEQLGRALVERHTALRETFASAPQQLSGSEVAMVVAVFGFDEADSLSPLINAVLRQRMVMAAQAHARLT